MGRGVGKRHRKEMESQRNAFANVLQLTLPPPHHFRKRRLKRKVQVTPLFFLKSLRVAGKNTTPIKMQTPAVLDLTFIYTLIRRNPFN